MGGKHSLLDSRKKDIPGVPSSGPHLQKELGKKPAINRGQEFRLRGLYQYLCFLNRTDRQLTQKQCKGPLKFTPQQFLAAKDAFVQEEQSRWLQRARSANRRNPPPVEEKWTDWKMLVPQLDRLRMIMFFAQSDKVYEKASRKFDEIIRTLKPRKKKEHVVKKDPIGFIQTYAERLFLWALLQGEHETGLSIVDLRRHYQYLGKVGASLEPLTVTFKVKKNNKLETRTKPVWIGTIQEVHWEAVTESTLQNDPRTNANQELADFYHVSAESIPILLSYPRWLST